MDSEGKRQGLEQVRTRIEGLRNEIEDLTKIDKRERLTRQSGVPWDGRSTRLESCASMRSRKSWSNWEAERSETMSFPTSAGTSA